LTADPVNCPRIFTRRKADIILRRLAHSIRKQDWLAVVIEFVIVVTGNSAARQWEEFGGVVGRAVAAGR